MKLQIFFLALTIVVCTAQQQREYTTPVPILKQINRHNEDGSYSYGYEGADGSFKIESKYADGQVYGKYGYVDGEGKLREVEYGASKDGGFQPQGTGINVPPPTKVNDQINPLGPNEEDDGQYREDPNIYNAPEYNRKPSQGSQPLFRQELNHPAFRPQPQYYNQAPQQQPQQQPQYQQPQYQQQQYQQPQPQPQYYNPPAPQQQYYNRPAPLQIDQNLFRGHPASNFDVSTGSYTINYSGKR